jgi:hypothetical protein
MDDVVRGVPHMDDGGLNCFVETLAQTRFYLEYGCGGSTIYAADTAQVDAIISIESDPAWVSKVRSSVKNDRVRLHIEHCDIGDVGDWGVPKDTSRIAEYWTYSVSPWRTAKRINMVPDVVLIDGRFRVASFLYSLISARVGTKILFDDYFDRPEYFVVEQFCRLHERHSRMGVFYASTDFSFAEISACFAKYSIVSN